jgi:hypothetical protein
MVELILLTREDLPFLLETRNDPTTRVNLENDSIFTLEQCKTWFDTLNSPWYIIKVDNLPVGYLRTSGSTVGCDIHPKYRRMGYAKKAYLKYLEDKSYADLWVFEDNFAKNLYVSLGFKELNETKYIRNRLYIKMEYKNENRN